MFDVQSRARVRESAGLDNGAEARTALQFKRFCAAAVLSGLLLFLTITAVVVMPFLAGHSLHDHWEIIGQYLVVLALGLLQVFLCTAGLSYGWWTSLRAIDRRYARRDGTA